MLELLKKYIFTHAALSNFAYFSFAATLVIALKAANLSTTVITFAVVAFSWSYRGSRVVLAPLIDKISACMSLFTSCFIAAFGFILAYFAHTHQYIIIALVIIGIGMSVNVLSSKQIIATESDAITHRERVFSLYNVVINIAAILAPLIAIQLLQLFGSQGLYLFLVLWYLLLGLLAMVIFNRHEIFLHTNTMSMLSYRQVLLLPSVMRVLTINTTGWFFCGLLYSFVPLYIMWSMGTESAVKWTMAANALLVVVSQMPLTYLLEKQNAFIREHIIAIAHLFFAFSFCMLLLFKGWLAIILFILFFTFASMLFTPNIESRFVKAVPATSRARGYSLLSISAAIGESGGSSFALNIYKHLGQTFDSPLLWHSLMLIALGFSLITGLLFNKRTSMKTSVSN